MSFAMIAMAAVSSGVSSAGTGLSAYGTVKQGADDFRAAQKKANRVLIDSKFKIQDIERNRIRVISSQRASYAASGVKLEGSPLEVLAETNYYAGVDKARTEYEARTSAEEIRLGGRQALDKARLDTIGVITGGVGKAIGAGGQGAALPKRI